MVAEVKSFYIPSPEEAKDRVFPIGHGVEGRWQGDGKILSFHLSNVTRDAVDTLIKGIERGGRWALEKQQPMLLMYEMDVIPLTPYMRKRGEDLMQKYPQIKGRVAVVMRTSPFMTVFRLFLDRNFRHFNPNLPHRLFTDREEAMRWLLEICP